MIEDITVHAQTWLADVVARLQDYPAKRIEELQPLGLEARAAKKTAA